MANLNYSEQKTAPASKMQIWKNAKRILSLCTVMMCFLPFTAKAQVILDETFDGGQQAREWSFTEIMITDKGHEYPANYSPYKWRIKNGVLQVVDTEHGDINLFHSSEEIKIASTGYSYGFANNYVYAFRRITLEKDKPYLLDFDWSADCGYNKDKDGTCFISTLNVAIVPASIGTIRTKDDEEIFKYLDRNPTKGWQSGNISESSINHYGGKYINSWRSARYIVHGNSQETECVLIFKWHYYCPYYGCRPNYYEKSPSIDNLKITKIDEQVFEDVYSNEFHYLDLTFFGYYAFKTRLDFLYTSWYAKEGDEKFIKPDEINP